MMASGVAAKVAGWRCRYRNRIASQVHHLDYSDLTDISMLVSVCKICHDRLHGRHLASDQQRRVRRQKPRSVFFTILRWLLV
jgi:hypothetical protein